MIWRLVLAENLKDGLVDIQRHYSVEDVYDAHEALDILEALNKESSDKAKQEAQ